MVHPMLSRGAIQAIFRDHADVPNPVVQVLGIKKITGPNGEPTVPERYRIVVSDGQYYHSFMLATQRNHLITDHTLENKMVVRLDEYTTNDVRSRRIMIVLRLEVLSPVVATIGTPANLEAVGDGDIIQPPSEPFPQPAAAAAPFQSAFSAQPSASFPQPQSSFGGMSGGAGHMAAKPAPQATFAGGAMDELLTEDMVIPIKAVSPFRNRWVVKGRVTSKSPIRTWQNDKGSGKLFKMDIADAEGGEISVSAFNKACDKFFPIVEEGKVYYVSRGLVKGANKKFSSANSNYEITLELTSLIQPAQESASIPRHHWRPVRIADLRTAEADSSVCIIAVVTDVQDPADIPSKQRPGERLRKRTFTAVDRSRASIDVTIWGEQVDKIEPLTPGCIVGIKGAKLSTFNGLTLSVSGSTFVELNPDIKESHELLGWWSTQGQGAQLTQLTTSSNRRLSDFGGGAGPRTDQQMTCADVRQNQLGNGSNADYFALKATVTMLRKEGTLYYRACPTERCNKKVIKEMDDTYRCEKCNQSFSHCLYRYVLSAFVSDHTGQLNLSCFNETGEQLLNQPAEQLAKWKESNDMAPFEAAIDDACFRTYKFKCRARAEVYNDERRVKYNVVSLAPVDYVADSIELISRIRQYA